MPALVFRALRLSLAKRVQGQQRAVSQDELMKTRSYVDQVQKIFSKLEILRKIEFSMVEQNKLTWINRFVVFWLFGFFVFFVWFWRFLSFFCQFFSIFDNFCRFPSFFLHFSNPDKISCLHEPTKAATWRNCRQTNGTPTLQWNGSATWKPPASVVSGHGLWHLWCAWLPRSSASSFTRTCTGKTSTMAKSRIWRKTTRWVCTVFVF